MADSNVLTPMQVAREALMVLKSNTVMSQLVNRDFDAEFREKGDTVMVRRTSHFDADLYDEATGVKLQNIVEGKVDVKLDKLLDVSVPITSRDLALGIGDFSQQVVQPAIDAIQQKIDEGLCALYADVPYCVGTPGTAPATVDAVTSVRKEMNDNKVPMAGRVAVIDTAADAKLLGLTAFNSYGSTASTEAISNAQLGRKFGFDFYTDQNIARHENGTAFSGTALKALGTLKLSAAVAKGASSFTIAATGIAANDVLKRGSIFTLAGDSKPYVLTEDATAVAEAITVKAYPAARVGFAINTEAKLVDSHVASLAFHRNAFALVTRPLPQPLGTPAEKYAVISDAGYSIRVVFGYDLMYKRDICSFDVLCGFKTMVPELACRILG